MHDQLGTEDLRERPAVETAQERAAADILAGATTRTFLGHIDGIDTTALRRICDALAKCVATRSALSHGLFGER